MLIIADLHLGKTSDSKKDNGIPMQVADTDLVLDEVLAVAVKTKQTIVVAGDVFNTGNPPSWVIAIWFAFLTRCKNAGIEVIQIPGNHDGGVDWINLAMIEKADLPNVTVISGIFDRVIDGVKVHFLPHLPLYEQDQIKESHGSVGAFFSERYPDAKFIIGHGQIRGIKYTNDIFYEAGDALDINFQLFPNCELMVLGHIHQHMIYGEHVVYPGSLTVTNFGEVDDVKGYISVNADLTWEFHEVCSAVTPWVHLLIDLVEKPEIDLSDGVIQDIAEGAILKITVKTDDLMKVNEAMIRKAFNKWGYVSRFETVAVLTTGKVVDTGDAVERLSYADLLTNYLKSLDAPKKIKALAKKKGIAIIEGVVSVN